MFLTFLFRDIDFVKITLSGFLILALLYLVLISFFILISFKIYRFEKKEQLKVIFETLKVIKEKSAGSHQNNNQ
jgi:predicted membrane protein